MLILTYIRVCNGTLNLQEYFPDIHLTDENRFIRLFSEIAHRTLDLVAKWQGKYILRHRSTTKYSIFGGVLWWL